MSELAREQARAQLHEEITALRASQMDELNAELAAERAKSQARLEQERQRMCDQSEQTLRSRAGGILANYLQRLASPALEASVVELFLSDLAERRAEVTQALAQDGAGKHPGKWGCGGFRNWGHVLEQVAGNRGQVARRRG